MIGEKKSKALFSQKGTPALRESKRVLEENIKKKEQAALLKRGGNERELRGGKGNIFLSSNGSGNKNRYKGNWGKQPVRNPTRYQGGKKGGRSDQRPVFGKNVKTKQGKKGGLDFLKKVRTRVVGLRQTFGRC